MASSDEEVHDYTGGASAVEISQALSSGGATFYRSRRDSQVGSAYDDDGGGAIFDGLGSVNIPSSVTSMHHERMISFRSSRSFSRSRDFHTRRMSSNRPSLSGRRSSGDAPTDPLIAGEEVESPEEGDTEPEEGDIGRQSRGSQSRRPRPRYNRDSSSSSSPQASRSVLGNLSSLFMRTPSKLDSEIPRRSSQSRRSSASISSYRRANRRTRSVSSRDGSDYAVESEDEGESWGYHSGEEESLMEDSDIGSFRDDMPGSPLSGMGSRPPSPTSSLPLLTGHADPIFGDTRLDLEDPTTAFDDSSPAPFGPPSRQVIYITDEDIALRFVGFEIIQWKRLLWFLGCIGTAGVLGLIGLWLPRIWLRCVGREKGFKLLKPSSALVVVETSHSDLTIHRLQAIDYQYPLSTVFSGFQHPSPSRGTATPASSKPSSLRREGMALSGNGTNALDPSDTKPLGVLKFIDYRYSRYALDPRSGLFNMLRDWRDSSWSTASNLMKGASPDTRMQRKALLGENVIDVKGKSVFVLLVEEVVHPFYVFQIASIILWSFDDYYYYAFCIALISALSIFTTLVETKKTIERMREMSRFSCTVGILINGEWKDVDSTQLVPGDIVNLVSPPLTLFPADMFLLSGDAIVNESMLTGESVPVSKIPVNDSIVSSWKSGGELNAETAKCFLYTGTRVVRVRGGNGVSLTEKEQALAVVVRTGFNTTKGSLVRSMLFPKPIGFKFYSDSLKFIGFLAGMAILGFLASAFQFAELGVKWNTIMLRALDLITVVVPPALPATLSIGTSFAIGRLRQSKIFCISPTRVNVGGKVNVICFDKTGTLTEDGLDVLGVRSLERSADRFGELISDVHDLPLGVGKANFLYALATCHSLKIVNGEVIGDPLDAKMFEFTGWTLEEGQIGSSAGAKKDRPAALVQTVVRPPGTARFSLEDALKVGTRHAHFLELGVIKAFDFVSSLRRMSVVVKRLKSSSMEIYVKGAPEVMSDICNPDSFPTDYEDLLSYYTRHGYRVIAIAGKSIEGLSWLKAQRMKREQAESGLSFLGLIIFENKLKPGTTAAIQTLRLAHLACRMVTGDNPRTAISVGRECGLISQSAHVFYPSFIEGNAQTPLSRLEWSSVDDELVKLDDYSLKPLPPPPHHVVDAEEMGHQDYALVLTGDVFRWMINHAPLETLQRMLVKAQIFARMSPDEKHELVERLQSLGYTVAFCGDGANDCGALKAADVGLSLSEAEASVAAPFTSQTPDISCMIEVIKEGRAALVTSFSCFKYMALYSLIQFTTITLLYSFASSLGDFQFLYIDLFIIIPIAVTMGRTLPFPRIHPKRPTASLVSKKVLSSIIGQVLLTSAIQFWAFFWTRSQPWYEPPNPDSGSDKLETINYENTVLFLVSSFQYILVAAVFSIGPPYRKPLWTNVLLVISIATLTAFSTLVLFAPPQSIRLLLDLMPIPWEAKLIILGAVIVNVVVSIALERWAPLGRIVTWLSKRWRGHRRRTRDGKTYKVVEGGMR